MGKIKKYNLGMMMENEASMSLAIMRDLLH
jgi:hypothetical protein